MKLQQKHFLILIAAAAVLKLLYWSMSVAEYQLFPTQFPETYPVHERAFIANDAIWYINIARWGYRDIQEEEDLGCCNADCFQQSEYAFFPLFPLTLRATQWISGLRFEISSIIWSSLLSILAFLCFYRLANHYTGDERKSLVTTLLFMLFPFHYFYSMVYTESLFLVLLMLTLTGIIERRAIISIISFGLLVLCRPNGIAMLLPLFLFIMEEHNPSHKGLFSASSVKSILSRSLILLPGLLVFLGYCYYLHTETGFALAFVKAQAGWCKETLFPLMHLFRSGAMYAQVNSFYTLCFLLIALYITWRSSMRFSYLIIIWMGLLIPLSSSIVSMPRYISAIFPLFFWMGVRLPEGVKTRAILILMLVLHLSSFHFWVRNPDFLGL